VGFQIGEEHQRLQQRCQQLAADFATRAAAHDRDATHPAENDDRLRQEGFYALNIPQDRRGWGVGLRGHTLAFEALAQGCPSTKTLALYPFLV
jgi:alkylation response protein AidB-like acyl-CoA dehydrogenase